MNIRHKLRVAVSILALLTPLLLSTQLAHGAEAPASMAASTSKGQLLNLTFSSQILKKDMNLNVYLPTGYSNKEKYPVLYAFHGWGSNHSSWMPTRRANTLSDELIAAGKIRPFIIVAPDMGNSYGMNTREETLSMQIEQRSGPTQIDLGRYEDYVIKELIPYIEKTYSALASREGRYIGGVSMGGFISAAFAFKYPALFSKVGLHSAAIRPQENWDKAMLDAFFPPSNSWDKNNPLALITRYQADPAVSFYVDCGEQDSLFPAATQITQQLKEKGAVVQFHSAPGGHGNAYTNPRIQDYLMFYGAK